MNKKTEIICGILFVVFLMWIVISTVEVWNHQMDDSYVYRKGNAWALLVTHVREMRVVECNPDPSKGNGIYIVTVEDINGNQFDYLSDEVMETQTVVTVTMQGSKVADVKE